jgi:hypothetical protein
MTIAKWIGGWLKGLSSDTKPTGTGLTGYTFIEINTGDIYYFNGTTWTLINSAGGNVGTAQSNTFGDFDQIFRSSRFLLRNPANTFSYIFATSAIGANRTITIPLLTGNDNLVTEAHTQTFTNKTISAANNSIVDSVVTAGAILKSNGTKYIGLPRGTANQILTVNAGGTDIVWSTPAGGGNVSTGSSNTYGDFDQIFRSARVIVRNPANTFGYNFTASAIAADRTVTIPLLTAGDTLVMEAFAATITNKTINATNNTITDTSTAAGDILKSNGSKFIRFGRGTANQVLAVNAGGTDIAWTTAGSGNVSTSGANTYGDFDQIFRSSRLKVTNPANTFNYSITGSAIAAARNLTLPLLTADDIVVTEAFAQTLSNKTINIDSNTLKHSTTNAAGDLYKSNGTSLQRLARGTANQLLQVNAGGTDIAWQTVAGATAREDLATTVSDAIAVGATTSYITMKANHQRLSTSALIALDDFIVDIDFTNKTQFRASFHVTRDSNTTVPSGSVFIRVVDSTNSANILFETAAISTEGRQTVTLTALPGWATGKKTIVPHARTSAGTKAPQIVGLNIWLK